MDETPTTSSLQYAVEGTGPGRCGGLAGTGCPAHAGPTDLFRVVLTNTDTAEISYGVGFCRSCLCSAVGGTYVDPAPVEEAPMGRPKPAVTRARKKRSLRQERDLAEAIGGRQQPGSGAIPGLKGDVRLKGVFRCESKSTVHRSWSLKLDDLAKIRSEAGADEAPAFDIIFLNPNTLSQRDRWVAIPFEEFTDYAARLAEDRRPRRR